MTDKKIPVDSSKRGDNSYYLHCDTYGGRPGYAICILVMEKEARGNNAMRPECGVAMKHGRCPAQKMREEELAAGEALYYTKRELRVAVDKPMAVKPRRPIDKDSDSYKRGWNRASDKFYKGRKRLDWEDPIVTRTVQPVPMPVRKPKTKDVLDKANESYADVITAAVGGLSMLERAKLAMRKGKNGE